MRSRRHSTEHLVSDVRHGRFERSLSGMTAIGALITGAEIWMEHDRASFGNRMMWLPVILTPTLSAAGLAGVFSRRREDCPTARLSRCPRQFDPGPVLAPPWDSTAPGWLAARGTTRRWDRRFSLLCCSAWSAGWGYSRRSCVGNFESAVQSVPKSDHLARLSVVHGAVLQGVSAPPVSGLGDSRSPGSLRGSRNGHRREVSDCR